MTDFENYLEKTSEVGYVEQVLHSIVYVSGLPYARPHEVVLFETGEIGQVLALTSEYVEILLLSSPNINVGTKVVRTNSLLQIPVDDEICGNTVNPLGYLLNKTEKTASYTFLKKGKSNQLRSLEIIPEGINVRKNIDKPFETGVAIVDMIIPIGVGQRQLVIGDRKTGKTQFLLEVMHTQAMKGTVCIYGAIAKKRMDIKMIEGFIKEKKIEKNCIVVASGSSDPAGMVYLTPYSAMTIAEYFKEQGKNSLVILDDLSAHAKYYREITLLAKRFPGRSSYPGDIFYLHSRLLERAGNYVYLKKDEKNKVVKEEVAITCLPVAEIVLGDLSGYIQTNLMAMTDGHVFFDSDLFNRGKRPAVNPFLSVTRVGRQAQSNLLRDVNRRLTSYLVSLEKLREFLHFGAELSEETKRALALGDRVTAFFSQKTLTTRPININVAIIASLWGGFWRTTSVNNFVNDINKLIKLYQEDEKYRLQIDELITSANDFKGLIDKIKLNEELVFKSKVSPS